LHYDIILTIFTKVDHSRVKLQQLDEDDPTTDYINANYMPVSFGTVD
jgi:protein tyrosine phosphatase